MQNVLSPVVMALLSVACVDTSPDRVKLTAHLESVSLSVQKSSLVTAVSGGFDLVLEVGDLASADGTIESPPSFQLVTESDRTELLVLDALPQGASFPLTVSSGSTKTLPFTLTDQNTLTGDQATQVCAEDTLVAGTLRGSLNGEHPTTFESAPKRLGGCP